MKYIGNIVWLLLGGLFTSGLYLLGGILFCLTIIGIPFGVQLMKLGVYVLWPFGRELVFDSGEPGCLSTIGNLLWILGGWWEVAVVHAVFGILFCISIVGIPFGMKHFQIALASLFPFGQVNKRID